ncbi:hypothetical protein B0H11DRAFT_2274604 [Mycena galericulata]|nr:hypothetical protein B0H11DRAFT_2274604 [Mycena galericulata]
MATAILLGEISNASSITTFATLTAPRLIVALEDEVFKTSRSTRQAQENVSEVLQLLETHGEILKPDEHVLISNALYRIKEKLNAVRDVQSDLEMPPSEPLRFGNMLQNIKSVRKLCGQSQVRAAASKALSESVEALELSRAVSEKARYRATQEVGRRKAGPATAPRTIYPPASSLAPLTDSKISLLYGPDLARFGINSSSRQGSAANIAVSTAGGPFADPVVDDIEDDIASERCPTPAESLSAGPLPAA